MSLRVLTVFFVEQFGHGMLRVHTNVIPKPQSLFSLTSSLPLFPRLAATQLSRASGATCVALLCFYLRVFPLCSCYLVSSRLVFCLL
eukprot:90640-Hanusia_phi.AAC.1